MGSSRQHAQSGTRNRRRLGVRSARKESADLIALPTLDPDSPDAFVQSIHAAFTPLRAAELGIPIIRAETLADSMIVSADGSILAEAKPGFEGVLSASVKPERRWTLYRHAGDWFLYLSLFAVVAAAVVEIRKKLYSKTALPVTSPVSDNS